RQQRSGIERRVEDRRTAAHHSGQLQQRLALRSAPPVDHGARWPFPRVIGPPTSRAVAPIRRLCPECLPRKMRRLNAELAEHTEKCNHEDTKSTLAFFVSSCFRGCLLKSFFAASAVSALNVICSQSLQA